MQSNEIIYGINPAFEAIRAGKRTVSTAWIFKEYTKNPRLKKLVQFLGTIYFDLFLV